MEQGIGVHPTVEGAEAVVGDQEQGGTRLPGQVPQRHGERMAAVQLHVTVGADE